MKNRIMKWFLMAVTAICVSLAVGPARGDGVSPVAGDDFGSTYNRDEYGGNDTTMTFFGGPYTMSSELRDQITFDLTNVPEWLTVYAGNWSKVSSGILTMNSTTLLTRGSVNNIYGRYGYGFDFVYAFSCGVNKGAARSCSFSFSRKIVKGTTDWSSSRWTGTVTIKQDACSSIKYTITYAPGTYGSGSSVTDTKTAGAALTLRNALFTRTGYSQEGWSKSTYGTSKAYSLGGSYTTDADVTLYPYWVGKSYTVTLDMQGGSGGTSSKTATYGSAMPSITMPTRDGYVFGGYYTGTGGTGTKYYNADGSSAHLWDFTSSKTLYAKWTQHTATSYALLVGINKYSLSGASELSGCITDALAMKMVCTDYGNWISDNIVVLTNNVATLARFRQEISSLAAQAQSGDTVLIYDSGHGGAATDGSGNYTKDTYICAYDALYYDSTFATDLAKFNTGVKVIVMLDTCHSAGMFKSLSKSPESGDSVSSFLNNFIVNATATIDGGAAKSNESKGTIASSEIGWIAAADYDTTSADLGGMGKFTGFMVVDSGVLAGKADANSDNKITFKEIYDHAVDLSEHYSFSQVAQAANQSVLSSVSINNRHISLSAALDNTDLTFLTYNVYKTDGPASWVGQNLSSGSFARSAVLPNSNQAVIGFNVSGAGELSFKWKVSSEAKYDKLSFIIDNVTNDVIHGEKAWATKTVSVGSGSHEIVWSYSKDGSVSKGDDCGWLDQITWTPVVTTTYTITYNPGSNGTGSQQTATKTKDVSLTLLGKTFTRTGYTQTGWATSDGGSQVYALGASYTANADVTLYPVWTANTYTVTYKPGANGTGSQQTATKTYGVDLTLKGTTFTRTGYVQTGWATTDGGTKAYALWASYTANAAITLYPVWTPEINSDVALDNTTLTFTRGGDAAWFGQSTTTHDGVDAMQSGAITHSQSTYIQTTVSGPGVISFWWYASSEGSTYDYLYFSIDGTKTNSIGNTSCSWTQCSYSLPAGSHTLTWTYRKDGSVNKGLDAGFLDQVVWTPTYTVTYNPGSYGSGSQQYATKTNGVALALLGETFTRTGYAQTGWATSDGGAQAYALGASYSANAAVTLYPVWTAKTYTITYKPGSNGTGSQQTATKTHGVSLTLLGETFTRTGYKQTGWATSDGGSQAYALGATYTANSAKTLYPIWTPITYTVTYKPGSNGTGSQQTATKTYGVALTLLGETFTRTGYKQTGWATSDGGSQVYALGASYTANAATTLYPVWTAITYTVTYDPGTYGTGSKQTVSKTYGMSLTLLAATFTRSGYAQTGWTNSDGTQTFALGASYTANADITLYPIWTKVVQPPPDSSVIAEALGCESLDFSEITSAGGVEYWRVGSDCMLVSGLASNQWSSIMTTVHGPCFVDWEWACATNTSACALYLFVDNQVTNGTNTSAWKHRYLYVSEGEHVLDWCLIQGAISSGGEGGLAGLRSVGLSYPIAFDASGATGTLPEATGWEYGHIEQTGATNFFYGVGVEFELPSAETITKSGYTFTGWTCSTDGDVYQPGEMYTVPETSTVFTANWEMTPTYTISYKPGSNGTGSQQTSTKTYGVALTLLGETFTRTGYTQTGWATSDGGLQAYALGGSYTANAAVTLYPVWSAIDYSISYVELKGATNPSGNPATYTIEDETITFAALPDVDGYTFAGWNPTSIAHGSAGDVVVTAQWQVVSGPVPHSHPGWTAPGNRENWQTIYAKVYDKTSKTYLTHAESLLAAFDSAGNCIGVATLTSKLSLFMLNTGFNGSSISGVTLKYWDPTRGVIDIHDSLTLANGTDIGEISAPRTFEVGAVELAITLNQNYTWISIPLVPEDSSIASVFSDCGLADGDKISAPGCSATRYGGEWYLSPETFVVKPGVTYVVRKASSGASTLTVSGAAMESSTSVVSGWNWLGSMSITNVALSALAHSGGFVDNDKFSGQGSGNVSAYMGGDWYGMETLKPGIGYKVKLANAGSLSYDTAVKSVSKAVLVQAENSKEAKAADPNWNSPDNKENWQCIYAKVSDPLTSQILAVAGSKLAAFDSNGNCIGVASLNNKLPLFMLNVGFDGASISGVTLKYWDSARGVVDVNANITVVANEDIGDIGSPVVYVCVQVLPIPPLPPNPTSEDVYDALEGSADAGLQKNITEPEEYNAYSNWSARVKAPGGVSAAGAQAVKDSPNAWLSYALGTETLIANTPTNGQMKVERFEPTATAGSFDFTISIDKITVGDDAKPSNLAKVLGIEGGTTLDAGGLSSENVSVSFGTPENGKVKLTAGPKDPNAKAFFMKVRMNP